MLGDPWISGKVLLAPGNFDMRLVRNAEYRVEIDQSEPVNRHRPAVDVLCESVASAAGRNAVGVNLTGMGDDGARGMLKMKEAGTHTIARDRQSCGVRHAARSDRARSSGEVRALDRISDAALRRFA